MNRNIIVSSRVRVARNLEKYPFPAKITYEQSEEMIDEIKRIFENSKYDYEYIDINKNSRFENMALVEKQIISPDMLKVKNNKSVFVIKDKNISVMINEEDHIRIQSILRGDNIEESFKAINEIDDMLEANLEYAYDKKYGYITSCPTNLGTAMRASYMVHLPILSLTSQIKNVMSYLISMGMTVRGMYGEGSEAKGSLFQISNQTTLGKTEKEIIDELKRLTEQIISQEMKLRERIYAEQKIRIEDEISRAYGTLTNAKIMTIKEAMLLLSYLKLGIDLDVIDKPNLKKIDIYDLMIKIQKANIEKTVGEKLSVEERDQQRAKIIQEELLKD